MRTQFNTKIHQATQYLQDNIEPHSDTTKLKCVSCKQVLLCEGLVSHLMTAKHRSKVSESQLKGFKETLQHFDKLGSYADIQQTQESLSNDEGALSNDIVFARFQMMSFIVTHNLPFSIADNLLDFVRSFNQKHSKKAQQSYSIGRNHISEIVSKTMLPLLQQSYMARLEETPFSISLDEGSPKTGEKYLAVSARYFNKDGDAQPKTKLVDFIELTGSCTGESLKKLLDERLFSGPGGLKRRNNLMGISTDGASNMISSKTAGLTNRYKAETPYITVVHDYCHALNLVMKSCISRFPAKYTNIVSSVPEVFRHSSIKTYRLTQILGQNPDNESKIQTVLKYVPTRWTSFHDCLHRIVQIFEALRTFFEEEGSVAQKSLFNPENYKMLQLMDILLGKISRFIKDFEGDDLDILFVVKRIKLAVVTIAESLFDLDEQHTEFRAPSSVENKFRKLAELIDPSTTRTSQVYLDRVRNKSDFNKILIKKHPNLEKVVAGTSANFQKLLYEQAEDFFHETFEALKQRLPLLDRRIMNLDCMLLPNTSTAFDDIRLLGTTFTNIISADYQNKFIDEVMALEAQEDEFQSRGGSSRSSLSNFWKEESRQFPLIYRLACALQVLPYSTASIERNFSAMGIIKTLKRNQLSVNNLAGCLIIKQEAKNAPIHITNEMIEYHKEGRISEAADQLSKELSASELIPYECADISQNEEAKMHLEETKEADSQRQ